MTDRKGRGAGEGGRKAGRDTAGRVAQRPGAGGWWEGLRAAGPGPLTFACVCAALALAFFAGFVFHSGRMLFGTDMLSQAYQMRDFAVREIRAGRGLPLWNPFVYGGQPFLGVLPGPAFYPSSLLYLVMPLWRAIGWTFVLHVALAGVLAYWAARTLDLGRWASAIAGLAFMFGGWYMANLYGGHDGRMFAAALLPAVFALLERGIRSGRLAPFLWMGIVVALQIFTPHVQVMYYGALLLLMYGILRTLLVSAEGREPAGPEDLAPSRLLRLAGYAAAGFVVAALLGSVQLLPTLDLMRHAVRGGGQSGYAFASSWALPPQEVSDLFLPDLIGSLQTYWGSNPFKLNTVYLGAVPLALAAIGVAGARRDRRTWILAGLGLLGLLFTLGGATPVHHIAYAIVPFVKKFRAPSLMFPPVALVAALLAGIGVQRVLDARREGEAGGGEPDEPRGSDGAPRGGGLPWTWIWVASAPFLLLALAAALSPHGLLRWVGSAWFPPGYSRQPPRALAGALRATGVIVLLLWSGALALGQAIAARRIPRWTLAVLAVLLVADLWRVDARFQRTVDANDYLTPAPLVTHMEDALRPGERVWPLGNSFGPNDLMLYGIPAVTGMQNFRLVWYERLVGGSQSYRNLLRDPALWPMLDLRLVAVPQALRTPLLVPDTTSGQVRLYDVAGGLERPHAFFPAAVRAVEDTAAATRATLALGDPADTAVVELPAGSGAGTPAAGRGSARLRTWHPDEVTLNVDAERAGLLFVSEVWHPDWHAYVDGREVPVYRTDVAFRGVEVPGGSHTVRFVYRSPALGVAEWLAGLTLLVVAAALGWLVWRSRSGT